MPRTARVAPGGLIYHVLNRGVGRMRLFHKLRHYAAFEEILDETLAKLRVRRGTKTSIHFRPEAGRGTTAVR